MRYLMIAMFSAVLLAPLVGCEQHTKQTDSKNGLTGGETHTTETTTDTH